MDVHVAIVVGFMCKSHQIDEDSHYTPGRGKIVPHNVINVY